MESSFSTPIKFLLLSAQMFFSFSLLTMHQTKARRKLSVLKSLTKSKCITRVVK